MDRQAALDVVLHHASYQAELTKEVEELLYWAASDPEPEIAEPARRMLAARQPETWTPDAATPAEDSVKAFDALLAADRELRELFAAARSDVPAVRDDATDRLVDLAVSEGGVLREAVIAHLRSVAAAAAPARAAWVRRLADGLAGDERALRGLHSGAERR